MLTLGPICVSFPPVEKRKKHFHITILWCQTHYDITCIVPFCQTKIMQKISSTIIMKVSLILCGIMKSSLINKECGLSLQCEW